MSKSSQKNRQFLNITTQFALPEQPRSRAKKSTENTRELSEAELREKAAWEQVEETGQPVLLEDELLVPDGMSIWEAIELLPDDMREHARSELQEAVVRIILRAAKRGRAIRSKRQTRTSD